MPKYDLPPDEAERLLVLRSLGVLDTAPELEFDRIVALASRWLGVPIALVSLVDSDRQWFKARVGLGAQQTPREHAFCTHTILSDDVMTVPDATLDARFADNPLVTNDPMIRFYAGAPLIARERRIGTLCVIDRKPRDLSEDEAQVLQELAATVVSHLEGRRALLDVAERNLELAQLAAALERKSDEMERFAFAAAHDLNQPLRTISSFLGLLEEDYGDRLDGEGTQYLEFARTGALRLQSLTTGLLEYARADRIDIECESVSLDEVVEQIRDDLQVAFTEADTTLAYGGLPVVQAHRHGIYQVLSNLMANSLKFRRPDVPGLITIKADDMGAAWRIVVSDNGMGIPAGQEEQIFEPFVRASKATGVEGSGLGLAMARKVVERLGGLLAARQPAGPGAQFVLVLPKKAGRG